MATAHHPITRLVLIRHGQTVWNVEGRYQGQADPPLSAEGLTQATILASRLRRHHLDLLYTSPLARCRQTAERLAVREGIPVHTEPRLMEIRLGDWEGRLYTEIARDYPDLFQRWQTDPWNAMPPGGETVAQVRERVYAAIDEMLARHQGRRVGVVTHRIPLILLGMRYLNLPPDSVQRLSLPNASWVTIDISDDGRIRGRSRSAAPPAGPQGLTV